MLLTNTTKTSIFLLFLLLNLFTCLGQGSVRLTKKKLFFDRSSPNKELGVWNVTDEEQEYTIFLRKSIMNEQGAYVLDTVNAGALDKNVRFFPRTFKLAPGEVQKVRVQIRDWIGLQKDDDYTHLFIKETTALNEDEGEDGDASSNKKMGTDVKIVIEVGIPIIIQKGGIKESSFMINESELIDGEKLRLDLGRIGDKTRYCKIKIFHIDPETEERTNVGTLSNFVIFSNMNKRDVTIKLKKEITSGNLQVVILEDKDSKNVEVLTQKDIKV